MVWLALPGTARRERDGRATYGTVGSCTTVVQYCSGTVALDYSRWSAVVGPGVDGARGLTGPRGRG